MNIDTFQNFDPKTLIEMFLGTREQTYDNVEEFIHTAKHNVARGLRPFHVDMSNGVSLDIRFNLEMDTTDAVRPMWYAVKVRYAHDNNWLFERHVADIDKNGVAYYSDPEHIKALSTGENSYSYKVERMVNTILARYERSTVQHFGKCITIVSVKMPNGFVLTESSTCVHPGSFDIEIGTRACIGRLKPRVWMLVAYDKMTKEVSDGNCGH